MSFPIIFGHRGASYKEPENTHRAFKRAFAAGAEGIEFDIHLTADKEIVVIHDEDVDRTSNGTGLVEELTLKELRQLDFGKGEQIPTLESVLKQYGNKYWLNIEIKAFDLEKYLVDLIHDTKITEKVLISSFYPDTLVAVHSLDKNLPTALLYFAALDTVFEDSSLEGLKEKLSIAGIHPFYELVTKNLVKEAKNCNLAVRPWTVDDPSTAYELSTLGVDAIITNNPKTIIAKLQPKN